ncbi:MAG: glycosyltransferase family 4 protein [Candidatus Helarchaeota archaeon]
MKKLNILMVGRYVDLPGKSWGGDNHSKKLGQTFAKLGNRVIFINCNLTREENNIKFIKLNYNSYRNSPFYPNINQIAQVIKKNDFDVIQTFSTRGYIYKFLKNIDIPKIQSQLVSRLAMGEVKHSFELLLKGKIFRYLAWRMDKVACKNADRTITTSRAMKKCLEKEYKIKEIAVIPRGVDIESFKPTEYPKFSNKIVFTACRIEKSKGLDDLINAMKYINEIDRSIQLVIAGTGNNLKKINDLINTFGLNNKVILLGSVPHSQIPELISKSSVVVLPTPFEPFGAILIEAMACSRPVIGINSGGPQDIVDNGINGFLIEPHNPRMLADYILKIFQDYDKSRNMGLAGREKVLEMFTWENEARQYIDLYDKLIH